MKPSFLRTVSGFAIVSLIWTLAGAQQPETKSGSSAQEQDRPFAAAPEQAPLAESTPRFRFSSDPNAQVTIREDTQIHVRTSMPIGTRETRDGAPLTFHLSEDVVVDGVLIIPRGAAVHGQVVKNRPACSLSGRPTLVLQLTSLDLEGRTYPLYSYQFKVEGASKNKEARKAVASGAVVGAVIGESSRRATGSSAPQNLAYPASGAAVGAGVGALVAASSTGPIIVIPAEAQIEFALAAPMSVVPVSREEAARLSGLFRAVDPVLYVRGERP